MSRSRIMVLGLGDVGGDVLEMLVRAPGAYHIITGDVREEWGYRKTNIAAYGAAQLGCYPELEFTPVDLFNVEQTAETIVRYKPDIIYVAATLQSWWVISTLPPDVFEELDEARYGPWLPMHLLLVYRLMQAVQDTGLDVKVINSCFPDAVNPVLAKAGLGPTIGIGNVANPIPAIRASIGHQLGVAMQEVTVYFVCQHFLSYFAPRFGHTGGAPYYLKAIVNGDDVTGRLDIDAVFGELSGRFRRVGGRDGQILTASSGAATTLAMANDTRKFMHAPGPNGLPGGYPVRVDADGGKVVLPSDITLEEAVEINEQCARFDGIERIDDDGTIHFVGKNMRVMKDMLGYYAKSMELDETEERYRELDRKFTEFASQYQ